jgi:hypothetical protein
MSTTNPKDFLELLTVFHFGLTNGCIDKHEIINWADAIIKKDTEPDIFIIELSLCGHKNNSDIITLISGFFKIERTQLTERVILGFLHRQLVDKQVELRKFLQIIRSLAWDSDLTYDEKIFIYQLDDDFDNTVNGIYSSVELVEKDAIRFTEIYKDFRIDNFHSWGEINKTIEERVQRLLEIVKNEQEITKAQTKQKWWRFW